MAKPARIHQGVDPLTYGALPTLSTIPCSRGRAYPRRNMRGDVALLLLAQCAIRGRGRECKHGSPCPYRWTPHQGTWAPVCWTLHWSMGPEASPLEKEHDTP
jgi:hypothetical protein